MLFETGVNPAVFSDVGLFELDCAAGEDFCQNAEAEVDGVQDVRVNTSDAVGFGVNPEASIHAGEGFGGDRCGPK